MSPSEFEELRRLRREVEELRVEKEILRTAAYFAQETSGLPLPIRRRSSTRLRRQAALSSPCGFSLGFYAFLARPASTRQITDARLNAAIGEIYQRSHHLVGAHTRRRWRTARPGVVVAAADLVRRNFDPLGPDVLWAADVTQMRTGEDWLYLAAVLDLWSRRVVGWAMGNAVNAELVGDALLMAFQRRRPDHRVVHHSDRGAVGLYVPGLLHPPNSSSTSPSAPSAAATTTRRSNPTSPPLKRELAWIHQRTTWPTRTALRSTLFDYIEGFYNPERIQRRLDHQSPIDFENHAVA